MGIVLVIAATAAAMLVLVAFGDRLFEENRTRQPRRRRASTARPAAVAPLAAHDVEWRTLVGAGRP